jgi:hypothetical protein
MNEQTVFQVELFDQTPAICEHPRCVMLVYFSKFALQMMRDQRKNANVKALQIGKNLTQPEWFNIAGTGSKITHPLADLDTLGEPTAYPDDAGSRVWVAAAPEGSMYQTASSSS